MPSNEKRHLDPLLNGLQRFIDRRALTPASTAASAVQRAVHEADEQLYRACEGPQAPELVHYALNNAMAALDDAEKQAKEARSEVIYARQLVELVRGIVQERQREGP